MVATFKFSPNGTMPKLMIIETWLKILDPLGYDYLTNKLCLDFFEKLARPRSPYHYKYHSVELFL